MRPEAHGKAFPVFLCVICSDEGVFFAARSGLKVETQNFASHKQGYAFVVCDVLFAGVAIGWT